MNRIAPAYDVSLYSIPAAFFLGLVPHAYALVRMISASGGQWSNVSPRQNMDRLKGKVPDDVWKSCNRALAATSNSFEVFPLYVAAVLGGRLAGVPTAEVNSMSMWFLTLRSIYTVLYINHRTETGASLRSLVYHASVAVPTWTLIQAGRALNALLN